MAKTEEYIEAFVGDVVKSVIKSHVKENKKINIETLAIMKECSAILLNLKKINSDNFDDPNDEFSKLSDDAIRNFSGQS